MLILLLVIVLLYAAIRTFLPVFIVKSNSSSHWKLLPGTALYQLYAREKVLVPTGQWRTIPTGITVAPFGVIRLGKWIFYPFGRVGCRIYPPAELKLKGLEILATVYTGVPREEITVIGSGWNPDKPFVVRSGDLVAYAELYRIPSFTLWEILQ